MNAVMHTNRPKYNSKWDKKDKQVKFLVQNKEKTKNVENKLEWKIHQQFFLNWKRKGRGTNEKKASRRTAKDWQKGKKQN